jgi:hypothetical protein
MSSSRSNAGTNAQISFTFSLMIPAAYSLPPEVTNNLLLG